MTYDPAAEGAAAAARDNARTFTLTLASPSGEVLRTWPLRTAAEDGIYHGTDVPPPSEVFDLIDDALPAEPAAGKPAPPPAQPPPAPLDALRQALRSSIKHGLTMGPMVAEAFEPLVDLVERQGSRVGHLSAVGEALDARQVEARNAYRRRHNALVERVITLEARADAQVAKLAALDGVVAERVRELEAFESWRSEAGRNIATDLLNHGGRLEALETAHARELGRWWIEGRPEGHRWRLRELGIADEEEAARMGVGERQVFRTAGAEPCETCGSSTCAHAPAETITVKRMS